MAETIIAWLKKTSHFLISNAIILSFFVYTAAWLLTMGLARLFWGYGLVNTTPWMLALGFLIPLILVLANAGWAWKHTSGFRIFQAFFFIFMFFALLNLLVLHFPLQNYGDNGQLSDLIHQNQGFERWMLGSVLLNSVYHSLWMSVLIHHLLPVPVGEDFFLRASGAILMGITALFILNHYPRRLAVLLPFALPIWLLLSSGYNEYYPFITPILMICLLALYRNQVEKLSPWLIGLICASLILLYPGFIPISLLILFIYTLRVGFRKGLPAIALSGVFVLGIIVFLWPKPLASFIHGYINDLNLGETNTHYVAYQGNALKDTPFFSPSYIFSFKHLRDVFFMFFWGGGLASILVIVGGLWFLFRRHVLPFRLWLANLNILTLAAFFLWQLFYLLIKIPRLGPVTDVDLFFSVYITCAFIAGLVIDKASEFVASGKKSRLQVTVFSLFAGNTASILLYLLFLGLPTPK